MYLKRINTHIHAVSISAIRNQIVSCVDGRDLSLYKPLKTMNDVQMSDTNRNIFLNSKIPLARIKCTYIDEQDNQQNQRIGCNRQ